MRSNSRIWITAASAVVAATLATVPADAVLVVKDPLNLAQTTATVRKLAEQYRVMLDELRAARAQVEALTSHSGYGDLLDGAAEKAARRYLPDAWSDAIDPGQASGAVGAVIADVRAIYRPASSSEIDPHDPTSVTARQYEQEVGTALAVLGGTKVMLDQVAARRAAYEALMARIETAADAKAAQDLANRIEAENGLAQNELVRAVAMQAHVAALQEMRRAAAKAASARAAIRTRVNLSGNSYSPAG